MKHKYAHKVTGEQVTGAGVELIGPIDNQEWSLTLSNGERMTMYDFSEQFEATGEIEQLGSPQKNPRSDPG